MREVLSRDLSLEELTKALFAMVGMKSLVLDGTIIEFFKALSTRIGPEYLCMVQNALAQGSILISVTTSLIILLHKGSPRGLLSNWRSITLLSVTYKILAIMLQLRLQAILMEVISPDQSTFLPIRFVLNNILPIQ